MMSEVIRIHPTGYDEYVPEDRPTVTATFGYGNTSRLEVHLQWTDQGDTLAQDWFALADLEQIIAATISHQNGHPA
jgi:hypothetical protein